MSGVTIVEVSRDEDGQRLDKWFKKHYPNLPFGRLQKLMRSGQVRLDGGRIKTDTRVQAGQEVRVPPFEEGPARPSKSSKSIVRDQDIKTIEQAIIYEDRDTLVLNKPAGLAVQGGSNTNRHVDGILSVMGEQRGEEFKLTHRLDKDTSGVLVIAKSSKAAQFYTELFRTNQVQKTYWALVVGVPALNEGQIDAPLIKAGGSHGEKMVVDFAKGKKATTYYRVVDRAGSRAAWLAMAPKTGRTHQLRIHCESMDTPILGDGKYGGAFAYIEGAEIAKQMHLHARKLEAPKFGGGTLLVEATLSPIMKESFSYFGFDATDPDAVFGEEIL
ncbi:RluA family pseudouridine synthase [Alphaproteobacteria bacterium]|nr:RluA family pseudouridine synthase [Alphaproteobacteria bacterium]